MQQLDIITPDVGVGILSGGPLRGTYKILQLHFHWGNDDTKGSEHTINGRHFPIEMHIVHSKEGVGKPLETPAGLAVLGFMFEVDQRNNPALAPITDALKNVVTYQSKIPFSGSPFSIRDLISPVAIMSDFAYYSGSLTTPPCSEVVEWINFLNPLKISRSQLAKFRLFQTCHS